MPMNYWDLRARGRCPHCGVKWDGPTVLCDRCLAYTRAVQAELRRQRREKGLCLTCGDTIDNANNKTCRRCREYASWYNTTRQRRNREKGLCGCGAPPEPGRKMCAVCRDRRKTATARYRARKKEGHA